MKAIEMYKKDLQEILKTMMKAQVEMKKYNKDYARVTANGILSYALMSGVISFSTMKRYKRLFDE